MKIVPYYCVVNCMDDPIEIRQFGFEDTLKIKPFESSSWHKANKFGTTKIQIRSEFSVWSFGCVNISEVGSTSMLLPSRLWFPSSSNSDSLVLHVEVKLAEGDENCAVCVLIWKTSKELGSAFSISNDSDLPVTIHQAGLLFKARHFTSKLATTTHEEELKHLMCVPSHTWMPFGWTDPLSADSVVITIGTPPHDDCNKISLTLELLRLNEVRKLVIPSNSSVNSTDLDMAVFVTVIAQGNGKVIRIVNNLVEFGETVILENSGDVTPFVSATSTGGAIAAGAVIGTIFLGPLGTLLVAGGTYAVMLGCFFICFNKF